MLNIIEKRNGIWKPVYHSDHLFKLSSTADKRFKDTIKSAYVKLLSVQAVTQTKNLSKDVVVLTTSGANLIKVVFTDSKSYNKQYAFIGKADQFNSQFEHGVLIRNRELGEEILNCHVLGFALTSSVVNEASLYNYLKTKSISGDGVARLSELYTTNCVANALKYKKLLSKLVNLFASRSYTAIYKTDDLVERLVGNSKLSNLESINLWLFDNRYLKSQSYKNDCKLITNVDQRFDKLALTSAILKRRIANRDIICLSVNSLTSGKANTIGINQRPVLLISQQPEVFIKDIKIDQRYAYGLIRLSDSTSIRIGCNDYEGPHTLHFSFKTENADDTKDRNGIDRVALCKMFDIVDGQYTTQSFKNKLGLLKDALQQISSVAGVRVEVDSMNNKQDLTDLYDKLSDADKVYGYNLITTISNFVSFVSSSGLERGLLFEYLRKLNTSKMYRFNIEHTVVE